MKPLMTVVMLALLVAGASVARAHDNFRVIGTVTKYQNSVLDVKSREGKTTSVKLDKQTAVTRDKKKIDAKELKVGQSVVVDAYGDTEDDLLALDIRVVPPIAAR